MGKRELRTPHGKRRGMRGDIKNYFSETRWQDVDWVNLPQDRAKWHCCCGNESSGSIQCRQCLD